MQISDLKPLQRQALCALLDDHEHILKRCRGGYIPVNSVPTGPVFTVRTVNGLRDEGLVTFDPPQFPTYIRFSQLGRAMAEQLRDATQAKAGVA